jgi:amino acid permease
MLETILLINLWAVKIIAIPVFIISFGFIYFLPSVWAWELYNDSERFYKTLALNILFGLVLPFWIILLLYGSGKIWKD